VPPLELDRFDDAASFLEGAGLYLEAREVEHALILGIAGALAEGHAYGDGPPYFALVRDGDTPVAAALRTPPRNAVLSLVDDDGAIDLLARDLLERSRPPGILGPSREAKRFVEAWRELTGERGVVRVAERLYRLTSVRQPAPVEGSMRPVEERDRSVVVDWIEQFEREAFGNDDPEDGNPSFDARLEGPSERTGMWLWEMAGRPLSITGYGGRTHHGMRVGPVYTPPEDRGHGYASALVAGVTQALLNAGSEWVSLYTDLSNPTSNHIYQELGYEPVLNTDQYEFEAAEES
jgi:hypothetical protein